MPVSAEAHAVSQTGAAPLNLLELRRLELRKRTPHLLNVLKEELFAVESEKISGTITPAEYAEVKAALETVLRRALKKS